VQDMRLREAIKPYLDPWWSELWPR
jgi:hypothetical protein